MSLLSARIILILLVFVSVQAAFAQNGPLPDTDNAEPATVVSNDEAPVGDDWKFARGAKEVNVELSYAPMQPTFFSGRKEYDTEGRKFAMASFKWGRVVGTAKGITWEYFFEIIPVAFAINNEVKNPKFVSPEETPAEPATVRKNTYGFGFEPAGFRLIFRPKKRIKPFFRAGAGFIFTAKPIPVPESPSYNFIGDFGGGIIYHLDKKYTMDFGYRYFHISNMNIGEINPGYNANVFYVGFSRFYK